MRTQNTLFDNNIFWVLDCTNFLDFPYIYAYLKSWKFFPYILFSDDIIFLMGFSFQKTVVVVYTIKHVQRAFTDILFLIQGHIQLLPDSWLRVFSAFLNHAKEHIQ